MLEERKLKEGSDEKQENTLKRVKMKGKKGSNSTSEANSLTQIRLLASPPTKMSGKLDS